MARERRRQSITERVEVQPQAPRPRDRCTLTMLTGPSPGSIYTVLDLLTIGRAEELPWPIEDRGVSARHARLARKPEGFVLTDLDSTNGTYVNGVRIERPEVMRDGDRIQLGEHTLIRVSLQDQTEQEASRKMYEAAVKDPLTGVFNRGHLEAVLVAEFAYAQRHRAPLSVIFVDLDHFTAINNTHGHQTGDAALRAVAQAMRSAVRVEDLVARYGGEEFVLLARGIDLNGAVVMAERVRRTINSLVITVDGRTIGVTASLGVACYEAATPFTSAEQLIAAADRAVYRAKAAGRDRVCESTDAAPDSWRTT